MKFKILSFFLLVGLVVADDICTEDLDPADDPKNIERPCLGFDLDCVREYFWNNSECQIVEGPVSDQLLLNYHKLHLVNSNITIECYNANFEAISAEIVEFYVNTHTDKLVFALQLQGLKFYSPLVIYKYNRKCKEPIERRDYVSCVYGPITFTVVFPSICNLDLNKAEVYTYIEDSNLDYTIGPDLFSNLDSSTQKQYEKLIASVPLNMQEGFVSEGKIFMQKYIGHNICSFV